MDLHLLNRKIYHWGLLFQYLQSIRSKYEIDETESVVECTVLFLAGTKEINRGGIRRAIKNRINLSGGKGVDRLRVRGSKA